MKYVYIQCMVSNLHYSEYQNLTAEDCDATLTNRAILARYTSLI